MLEYTSIIGFFIVILNSAHLAKADIMAHVCSAALNVFPPGVLTKKVTGFEITLKNHCDRDTFEHSFKLQD